MNPLISIVRVRRNGVPAGPDNAWRQELLSGLGDRTEFLELPHPAYQSARDFAEAFFEAMGRARGEWVYVSGENARPDGGALARVLERLGRDGGAQGAVLAGRTVQADGRRGDLFTAGFSAEVSETGKAENPGLADPAWLLSFLVLKLSQARLLAEELVRTLDPIPDILAYVLSHRVSALVTEGVFLEVREPSLTAVAVPGPDVVIGKALADFEAGREEEAIVGLDAFRLGWGHAPVPDLYRCVLNAKRNRTWEAAHMTRMFLRRNPGNPQATKLIETIGPMTLTSRMAFSTAARSMSAAPGPADSAVEQWLFEKAQSLHDQAVILEIAPDPLRTTLAMAYASMGSARRIHALASGGERDVLKAALVRHDLDDIVETRDRVLEALRSWGDRPRPDMLVFAAGEDREAADEQFRLGLALVKEGGWVVVRGAAPERVAAWRAWIGAERGLREKGRVGELAFGRKAPAADIAVPSVTFPELWKRMRLDFPNERTMITPDRFRNAFSTSRLVDIKKLPGAVVECGVWKGGCSSAMLLGIQQAGAGRHLWAFDSFQGLPKPTEKDGSYAFQKSAEWGGGGCEATEDEFRETLFQIAELKDLNVHVRKGWFQDTLPTAKHEIGPIAILRLDGDWYESVLVCLEHLYDQVVPGGYIIIDDYGYWEGARKATDEFREKRGIKSPLITTDHDERYWMKVEEGPGWSPGQPVRAAERAGRGA